MSALTGILIGIYIYCLAMFFMIYLFLDSIRDELRETNRLLKRRLHNESLQNLHEGHLEGKDA